MSAAIDVDSDDDMFAAPESSVTAEAKDEVPAPTAIAEGSHQLVLMNSMYYWYDGERYYSVTDEYLSPGGANYDVNATESESPPNKKMKLSEQSALHNLIVTHEEIRNDLFFGDDSLPSITAACSTGVCDEAALKKVYSLMLKLKNELGEAKISALTAADAKRAIEEKVELEAFTHKAELDRKVVQIENLEAEVEMWKEQINAKLPGVERLDEYEILKSEKELAQAEIKRLTGVIATVRKSVDADLEKKMELMNLEIERLRKIEAENKLLAEEVKEYKQRLRKLAEYETLVQDIPLLREVNKKLTEEAGTNLGKIQNLTRQLEAFQDFGSPASVSQRIANLEKGKQAAEVKLHSIEEDRAFLRDRYDRMKKEYESNCSEFHRLKAIEAKFDRHEAELTAARKELKVVEENVVKLGNDKTAQGVLAGIKGENNQLKEKIEQLKSEVLRLQRENKELQESQDYKENKSLKSKLDTYQEERALIQQIVSDIDRLEKENSNLKAELEKLTTSHLQPCEEPPSDIQPGAE